MTDQELQEAVDFYAKLKNATPVEFLEWLKAHKHNGNDFPKITYNDLLNLPTLEDFLAPGTSGNVPTSNGTIWVSQTPSDPSLITVTAGETLTAGEIVKLYTAVGNRAFDGFNMVTGTVYAVRAAANDTTYGDHVYGIAYENMTHFGTGRVKLFGEATIASLTANTKYYLSNYSAASSLTISQTLSGSTATLTPGQSVNQIFIPTSSRLDKVLLNVMTQAGNDMTVSIKRGNTTLATLTQNFAGSIAERTWDFSDVRTYKGELLNLHILNAGVLNQSVGYNTGTDAYSQVYEGDGTTTPELTGSGPTIPAGSDLYMKIYEFTDFGKLSTSAGTRKIKMGHSRTTSLLNLNIQYGDSIL